MDVKLPNLGEGADSGTVVSVLVKAGAPVKKGQNIIELETGKAVAPIPSPVDGVVTRLAVKEGDKLSVGGLILVVDLGTASGAPSAAPAAPPAAAGKGVPKPAASQPPAVPAPRRPSPPVAEPTANDAASPESIDADDHEEVVVNEQPAAGPYVRRVARDLGIDLRYVAGTGRSGQVMPGDLKAYVANLRARAARPRTVRVSEPAPSRPPAPVPTDFAQWGPVTRKPMTPLRRTIAARMVESASTLPTVTQFDEADVTDLDALRRRFAAAYEAKGLRLTMTSFFVRALGAVLRKHPLLNASLDDATGEIVLKDYVHIGMAVDTEAGLLVPVIRDADRKDLATLSREIHDLATKARQRKLALGEMQGGSFTLSNQGGIGGAHFTPIINKPESAILGLGRGVLKPVIREGNVSPRLMLPLALTYDHRLIDGGVAARFVVDLVAEFRDCPEDAVKL
ncbi:MAG: 2-oxo acid dehydrogenase subunit E2 [Verrucomicrobiales bacterium]|nr:2-oxo acid dehydrogenase subunit E2 [Verrucomicrobiales bacterium]